MSKHSFVHTSPWFTEADPDEPPIPPSRQALVDSLTAERFNGRHHHHYPCPCGAELADECPGKPRCKR